MTEFLLLIILVFLILMGGYFYYQSTARRPFRKSELSPFELGQHLLLEGDLARATKALFQAAKEDPDNVFARVRLGEVFRRQGDIERALKFHVELSVREQLSISERIAIHKALTEDFEAANLPEKALSSLDQLLALDKSNTWALDHSLQHLAAKGDWAAYIETCKKLASLRGEAPNSHRMAIVYGLEGDRLSASGKMKEGRLRYREALKYNPAFPGAFIGLAESYRREKRIAESLKEIEQLVENAPDEADVSFPLLEAILFEQGRFDEVEGFYKSFLKNHHHIVRGYVALATIADRKGETENALKILREGLEANPGSEILQYELARNLTRLHRIDELAKLGMNAMKRLAPPSSVYTCSACGYSADNMRWFCPSCGSWESFGS